MTERAQETSRAGIAARLKSTAVYVVWSAVAALLCAETALWTHDTLRRSAPEDTETGDFNSRFPAPYVMFHARPNSRAYDSQKQGRSGEKSLVITERHGFRYAEELSLAKPAGETRIFVLGGSVIFYGLSNDTTICGVLERLLNEELTTAGREGEVIKVINAGIVSGDSDQELAVLVHHIAELSPDVVLVIDGFNELWTRLYYEPRFGYPYNWSSFENAYRNNRMIRQAFDELDPLDYLLAMSKVATRLNPAWTLENRVIRSFQKAARPNAPPGKVSEAVVHQALVAWMRNWLKMYRFAGTLDARMVGILQPVNPRGKKEDQAVARFYELANQQIAQLRSQGFPFHSFDGILDTHPELFRDIVHTWDEGHPIFAGRIRDLLVDEGYLTLSDAP